MFPETSSVYPGRASMFPEVASRYPNTALGFPDMDSGYPEADFRYQKTDLRCPIEKERGWEKISGPKLFSGQASPAKEYWASDQKASRAIRRGLKKDIRAGQSSRLNMFTGVSS
jgi:hypothetical protein